MKPYTAREIEEQILKNELREFNNNFMVYKRAGKEMSVLSTKQVFSTLVDLILRFQDKALQPTKDSWDSVIDKVIEVLQNMDKEVVDDDFQSALIDRKEAVMLILALKTKQKETEE